MEPTVDTDGAGPPCLHVRSCPISGTPCPGECVFASVMQGASLGILVLDMHERELLFANQEAAAALLGVGLDYHTLESVFDVASQPLESLPLASQRITIGSRLIGYSLYGSGGHRWIFFRDITEKARLESLAESIELSNSLTGVFSTVRHEIGNPVGAVKVALSVLRRNLDRFPPETIVEYLDSSLAAIARIEDMLASLRSFNLAEEVRCERVQLADLLADVVSFVARGYAAHGIRVELRADEPVDPVRADPRILKQALINLFANAADALYGRPDPNITVTVRSHNDHCELLIADNGAGMTEATRLEVFKPFFTTKQAGSGLGLTIVRKMLARMGATIDIDSLEGIGTTVRILLTHWR